MSKAAGKFDAVGVSAFGLQNLEDRPPNHGLPPQYNDAPNRDAIPVTHAKNEWNRAVCTQQHASTVAGTLLYMIGSWGSGKRELNENNQTYSVGSKSNGYGP